MGWCGGTDVFDPVVKQVLSTDLPDQKKHDIILALINALFDQDYDCESESVYWKHPLIRKVLIATKTYKQSDFDEWDRESEEG